MSPVVSKEAARENLAKIDHVSDPAGTRVGAMKDLREGEVMSAALKRHLPGRNRAAA
jgi:hypothetical protein